MSSVEIELVALGKMDYVVAGLLHVQNVWQRTVKFVVVKLAPLVQIITRVDAKFVVDSVPEKMLLNFNELSTHVIFADLREKHAYSLIS